MDISKPYSYRNVDSYFQFNLLLTCDACLTAQLGTIMPLFVMFFFSITVLDIDISYDIDLSRNIKFQRPSKRAVNANNQHTPIVV